MWAVAVCIDLTCVMAVRERQRDKRLGAAATLLVVGHAMKVFQETRPKQRRARRTAKPHHGRQGELGTRPA
jgi:hypothetical protein